MKVARQKEMEVSQFLTILQNIIGKNFINATLIRAKTEQCLRFVIEGNCKNKSRKNRIEYFDPPTIMTKFNYLFKLI